MDLQTFSQRIVAVAITQLGTEEIPKGSNGGPQVNAYLKSVGLGTGYSWCMAFVYWCAQQAATQMSIANPLLKTGGVMRQWNETTLRKLPKTSGGVKPGDVFIMDFGGGTGHTGIVESVGIGLVHTIEGNTNDVGSREGYEVCRRTRTLSSIKGFIQLP